MIEVKNLNKSFKGISVLKNINLTIQDNEIYGLVGPSGVGKSTLLNCLMAILDKGEVSLTGNVKEIFENKPKELKELIGEDNQRISITLDIEDFVGVQKYLNETNTQYKVSGGF